MNTSTESAGAEREYLGQCKYSGCIEAAYYKIDFGCDDMDAICCNYHHNAILAFFGLPDCEGEDD